MTALQKPDRGVRGIVVGDVFRRLVARTIANSLQSRPRVPPTLSRAGTECVAHIVQTLTSMGENAAFYDSISRRAMFRGLADMVWREDHPVHEAILRQSVDFSLGR